ncbi:sec-independent translocase [Streptomyces purpurogeneiscleroticus]|uniref:sec-independent translocase n=1 Tax=Streptomyces purpurogeneiscleroticus TaxID=68259 RepID=UPI001CBDC528|nr:sec-independent translocase [Streptomyces purpurogeneiscleroticus]MBZ4015729.1 Sec-independent protein translocase TatB [Streptomyces purpurogeneiscleroticus]
MFFDIGPLELVALVILAVLIFGPDKLPKVIQDVTGFIRKVRQFSDSAKEDIRSELGPEFKDFEFDDLNPKNFVRKHVLEKDEYGLQDLRNGFDMKQEMAEVTEAVRGNGSGSGGGVRHSLTKDTPAAASGTSDRLTKRETPAAQERPPFDADAT